MDEHVVREMEAELIDAFVGNGPGPLEGRQLTDLNATLLSWPKGHRIEPHVNDEVDVVMVVFKGEGTVTAGEREFQVKEGSIVVIPKCIERSVVSGSDDFRYLNVHQRRRALMPKLR